MDDEVFTFEEACAFLKSSENIVRGWISSGRLKASGTSRNGQTGDYRLLKSDCIESIRNYRHNRTVNAIDVNKEVLLCQSNKGMESGTVTLLRHPVKELGKALEQRTKSKLRSSTTD